MSHKTTATSSVAIIGGGCSGISVFLQIVANSHTPQTIYLIEKSDCFAKGVAFGTESACHPLNVKASRMGIYADRPEDFYHWLISNEDIWRKSDSSFADITITPESYLPRKLYSIYLSEILNEEIVKASEKCMIIKKLETEIANIHRNNGKLTLTTTSGNSIESNHVVLATGIPPTKHLAFENPELLACKNYIRNVWRDPFKRITADNAQNIVILGSGLTAIDAILSLQAIGYRGKIHLISRGGKLPFSSTFTPEKAWNFKTKRTFRSCLVLFRFIRKQWNLFQKTENDWRDFIEGIRLHAKIFWKKLDTKEKKRFLRHLYPRWNRLRHRMSPESNETIQKLQQNGTMKILAGHIKKIEEAADHTLEVTFEDRKTKSRQKIYGDFVFNCTGPEYKLAKRHDTLITNLLQDGGVISDDLKMGLKAKENEGLHGNLSNHIYAIGSLLFGEEFESTAVPDIREQASSIAKNIAKSWGQA